MFRPLPYTSKSVPTSNGFMFFLHELKDPKNTAKMFSGNSRIETLTDVKYVDDRRIVVGHRDQKMLYLIEVDRVAKQARVLDRLHLVFGYPRNVTLLCVDGHTIYLSFLTPFVGVVQIEGNRLVKKGLFMMEDLRHGYHGITKKNNVLYLAGAMTDPKLVLFDMAINQTTDVLLPGLEGNYIKQTQLMGDYLVATACDGLISDSNPEYRHNGYVGIFKADTYECVDIVSLPSSQLDDIRVYGDRIFFIRQGAEPYGQVLQYALQDGKLVQVKEYRVGQFPHGLDIRNGIIACTSMKDSSIAFFPA